MYTLARRTLYFGYYLKKMDWPRLAKFMEFVKKEKGWSRAEQWSRIVRDSLRFNVSILEYYQFRFFDLSDAEKVSWAGTGTMYEFHRRTNPPGKRAILEDKRQFHEAYKRYFKHAVYTRDELERDPALAEQVIAQHAQLVFKPARGNCGAGIAFVESGVPPAETFVEWMRDRNYDLVEERVPQHPALQALSPSGVNTVRIFTCLDEHDRCRILGCRLRISVNSPVDNMAAGNLAAPVDEETGKICGPGVYSDITRSPESVHPVTGVPIDGFQILHWLETLDLVREASELHPQNRSIGWDIVITPDGPGLIEGNHDWCKLVWQLPVRQGLKHRLSCLGDRAVP